MRLRLPLSTLTLLLNLAILALRSGPHGSSSSKFLLAAAAAPRKIPVGLVLDLSTGGVVGRTSRTSIYMAVEDFYAVQGRNYSTRIDLRLRDYGGDVVGAAADVVDLIKNEGVVAVIGPQRPPELSFVAEIGTAAHVPIITFSATTTSLSHKTTPYFLRAANNDSAQAAAIAALVQAFGWRQLVPVYEDSDFGSGFVPLLVDALKAASNCRVPARSAIPPGADKDRIRAELLHLKTMQTRAFVVHARRVLAEMVFEVAAEEGMMEEGFAWVVTESVASLLGAVRRELVRDDMQGVIGVRPYVPTIERKPNEQVPRLERFRSRWRKQFIQENPHDEHVYDMDLSTFGLWAYDTVFLLSKAVEAVYGSSGSGAVMPGTVRAVAKTAPTNIELSSLPFSSTGERLLNAILRTGIPDGISGNFQLMGGELCCTAFEIVNVNGPSANVIGYWTESRGLSRKLNLSAPPENTTQRPAPTRKDLDLIRWPGGRGATPKGWEPYPLTGKKLRVYVPGPTEPGFHSFLRSDLDNSTNVTTGVTGFVIEVFEAAVKELPYAILWEYETNRTKEGKSIGNYGQLVELVHNGTYDGIVGDVTIMADRAEKVDFTLPYTASGVRMVVPKRDDKSTRFWIFLKPLTSSLWFASGSFFIFTGFAVWMSEIRVNEEFRKGSAGNKIGLVFYFSFSTLVYAHRQRIITNPSRVALVVWLFVVWILQSSYTASLTSMLTVSRVKPTVAEIKDLLFSGESIGYLENSFVKKMLLNMGFKENRLRHYKSPEQYADAFALGSRNGGIDAVVDEIPYLKIFLKDYCSNYTITGKTMAAGGFGFVFPKGSPLVPDLSRAILNITESGVMAEIERKWFGDESECDSKGSPISSKSLDLESFGGLFIITGATSLGALLCFLFMFLYRRRHILNGTESGESISRKVTALIKDFDKFKGDGYEGSLGSSTLRHRQLSHTHVCAHCGYNGMLPRVVGGDMEEAGSPRAFNTVTGLPESSAPGGHTATRDDPISSTPLSIDLGTPSRISVDSAPGVIATPSREMSPARISGSR